MIRQWNRRCLRAELRMFRDIPSIRSLLIYAAIAVQAACVAPSEDAAKEAHGDGTRYLFSASTVIEDEWQQLTFLGTTKYRVELYRDRLAISARGRRSSSGLLRHVEFDPDRCPQIEWSWSVAVLQRGADIRIREREDVAASIFLLFGDPGFVFDPAPVPTLRYVWTNERIAVESVIDSPYMPGTVRSLVVQSGTRHAGQWTTQKRDLRRDFHTAFGYPPPGPVRAVAIFTDNDQTGEEVEAYYEWARVLCQPRAGGLFHPFDGTVLGANIGQVRHVD